MSQDNILKARSLYARTVRDNFKSSLRDAFVAVNAGIAGWAAENLKAADSVVIDRGFNCNAALKLPRVLQKEMQKVGLERMAEMITAKFQDQLPFFGYAVQEATALPSISSHRFEARASRALTSMQSLIRDEINSVPDTLASQIRHALLTHLNGLNVTRFLEITGTQTEKIQMRMVNLAATGSAIYYRTLCDVYGSELEREGHKVLYQYGPKDNSERAMCVRALGGRYERREIEGMATESSLNPIRSGGGWNCQHVWMPVDVVR